jgi:hypothetical protein
VLFDKSNLGLEIGLFTCSCFGCCAITSDKVKVGRLSTYPRLVLEKYVTRTGHRGNWYSRVAGCSQRNFP